MQPKNSQRNSGNIDGFDVDVAIIWATLELGPNSFWCNYSGF